MTQDQFKQFAATAQKWVRIVTPFTFVLILFTESTWIAGVMIVVWAGYFGLNWFQK